MFTGTWSQPADPAWHGTFSAIGPIPTATTSGMTRYDFTTLNGGFLPLNTQLIFTDVDNGSGNDEIYELQAFDVNDDPIMLWLNAPFAAWSMGTITAGDMSSAMWDDAGTGTNSIYTIDGGSVPGNPNVNFASLTNQNIAFLEINKNAVAYGFGLRAPQVVVPIPPAVWLFGSGLLGLVGIARRKKAA